MIKIRLANKIQLDSILDGDGIRSVIWFQGCLHNCKGCHNPETHLLNGGKEYDIKQIKNQIDKLKNQDGITLSGGDPLFQVEAAFEIAKHSKEKGLNVWCYTGYTFEELIKKAETEYKLKEFLENIDVLVDGKFMINQKSMNLKFRGSKNQRILDMQESLKKNKALEIRKYKLENTKINYNKYNKKEKFGKEIFI